MAEHNSFLIYKDNAPLVESCTDEQAGKLFKALFAFACDGEDFITDDRMLKGFFTVFRNSIQRDDRKYQERCRVNAENGKKGGRPKNQTEPNASEGKQTVANGCDNNRLQAKKADSDSVTDSDSESDPVIDNGIGKGEGETVHQPYDRSQQALMDIFNEKRRQMVKDRKWVNYEEG